LPKLPRLTAQDAQRLLQQAGFTLVRSEGSHRIFQRGEERFVVPFHAGKILHPKIVKGLLEIIKDKV